MNTLLRLAIVAHFALVLPSARADEKNGLSVIVAKSVLETKNVRHGWTSSRGTFDAVERTQALKITAKNISFTPMPEGDLEWRIVVVSDKTSVLSSGNEKIRPLKPANTQEFEVGSATVSSWRSTTSKGQDRLEWQVAVKHGEKDILKMQSTPSFDALAKKAEADMAKALQEKSGK